MSESQIRQDELLQDLIKNKSKYKKIAKKMFKEGKSTTLIAKKLGWTKNGSKIIKPIRGATDLIRKELLQFETWEQYTKEYKKIKRKIIYDSGYTPKVKKQIKLRDGNRCVICKSDDKLVVHHIDSNSTNNTEDNLITICRNLHNLFQTHSKNASEQREAIQYVEYINSKQEYFKKIMEWKHCEDCHKLYVKVKNVN